MDDSFIKAPLQVPKKSGFDKSHQNLLTQLCGTITPILTDVLIPGSSVSLDLSASVTLPPLASDTFMRVDYKTEAFFVPFRLLCASAEAWFTDDPKHFIDFEDPTQYSEYAGYLPTFGLVDLAGVDPSKFNSYFGVGSLSDYLGLKGLSESDLGSYQFSLLYHLAYHRIYSDWYRNSLVQKECFLPYSRYGSPTPIYRQAGCAPYHFFTTDDYNFDSFIYTNLADGASVFNLRQRNFGLDYFTTATPSAQQGSAQTVTFSTAGATGSFSIAALRAANSMQQFKERNNIAGNLYVEQLYARYGVRPSDGVAQRSLFLGSDSFPIYSKGIFESQTGNDSTTTTSNPLGGVVGAQYGFGRGAGSSHLVEFEAKEPGILMVLGTITPRVTYSSGYHRRFLDFVGDGCLSDLANPILQSVGPQPIYQAELNSDIAAYGVFGYTDRYAQYKTLEDELHGLLRDNSSLESFALQRFIATGGSAPTINSSFLEIPTDYMDQALAVASTVSGFTAWVDTYFKYFVAQPLSKYSLPTLQDPAYEHGKTIVVNRGGFKL